MFPDILLIHSCKIEMSETLGTADAFGVKPATKTYTTVKCRFTRPSNPLNRQGAIGEQPVYGQGVILPTGTVVSDGKILEGLSTGYTKKYRVKAVRPALLKSEISHLVCDIEVV